MDEIVVKVDGGEETPPVVEPVIVVTEPAASSDAIVVFTLEQLAERVAKLETDHVETNARFESVNSRLNYHGTQISDMQIAEIVEVKAEPEAVEESVVVVESIPAEEVTEESAPKQRKRRFI